MLHLWDIRQGKSVKSVFGPHIAGDAIDYESGQLLLGCYAAKHQVQLWDYNKFEMRTSVDWLSNDDHERSAYVYTANFA